MSKTNRKFCSKQKNFNTKLVCLKRRQRRGCIKTFVGHKKDFKMISFCVDSLEQMEDEKDFAIQQQTKHERIEKIFDCMVTNLVDRMLFG